jgi:RimJ/RimL family protein N-acetyltransferase
MARFSGDLFGKDGATNMTDTERCPHRGAGVDTSAGIERRLWQMIDGTSVLLRPIEPGDFELERSFVDGLSRSTGYMRLMSGRWPTDDEIYRWTHIDRQREGALIATISVDGREQQIGVARYVVDLGKSEAELAIVIGDAWQGKGLGIRLLSSLIDLAKQSGVERLFGTTLSENNAMIGLGRRLGFMLSHETGAEVITKLSLDLHSRD